MGKRSRKRPATAAPPRAPQRTAMRDPQRAVPRDPRRRPPREERPKAPWEPFPLVELCVLIGLVLIVLGFLNAAHRNGQTMLLLGLALASLAGLEQAVREHFAGYRSHSSLLAGIPTVIVLAVLFVVRVPPIVMVAVAVVAFALAFQALRRAFQHRAGVSWR